MLGRSLFKDVGITRKASFTVFILVFNSFTWWYMTLASMNSIAQENLVVWAVYYIALVSSSFIGAELSLRIPRISLLYSWIFLGTFTSSLPTLLSLTMTNVLAISFLLGLSFGLGIPSCLSFFADNTLIGNRGRTGGVIYFIISISFPFFAALFSIFDLALNSMISVIWRGLGFIILLLLKPREEVHITIRKKSPFISILHNRPFILYFIPWIMFCLINRLEEPILRNLFGSGFYDIMIIIEFIIGSLFALIGGLLSDFIGRKRMVIYGFIALGLAYAFLGVASEMMISWYFYSIIDGAAWGIFMVAFILILWGDLSPSGSREKYYVIGSIPFLFADLIQLHLAPYIELIPAYAAFSFATFFLFLAVLPLMYAPETLPEKKIRLRQLRGYAEAAKKVREKYLKKSGAG